MGLIRKIIDKLTGKDRKENSMIGDRFVESRPKFEEPRGMGRLEKPTESSPKFVDPRGMGRLEKPTESRPKFEDPRGMGRLERPGNLRDEVRFEPPKRIAGRSSQPKTGNRGIGTIEKKGDPRY